MKPMDKLRNFPLDAIRRFQAIYNSHLSLEVREEMADWIDDQQWFEEAADETESITNAAILLKTFIEKLDAKSCSALVVPSIKPRCFDTSYRIREAFCHEPLNFVLFMQTALRQEKALIEELETPLITAATHHKIVAPKLEAGRLQEIENSTTSLQTRMQELDDCQKNLCSLIGQNQAVSHLTSQDEIEQSTYFKAIIALETQAIVRLRMELHAAIKNNLYEIKSVEEAVIGDIMLWKDAQKKEGFGDLSGLNLDQVQVSVELLFKVIWQSREIVKQISELSSQMNFNDELALHVGAIQDEINKLITKLLQESFVVEKQPVRVVNTKNRLFCVLRFLFVLPPIGNMKVSVSIINQDEAARIHEKEKVIGNPSSGEIECEEPHFVLHVDERKLRAAFKTLRVTKREPARRGNAYVTSEKFCLLFKTAVNLFGQLLIPVYTTSLPVVVVVHTTQEPAATGTIVWDDAFSEAGRVPFQVPQQVEWGRIACVLNKIFTEAIGGGTAIGSGRGLSADALIYLAKKAFRNNAIANYDAEMLKIDDFKTINLPIGRFNFWEWFYATVKLVRDYALTEWRQGKICGFISKEAAKQLLMPCEKGTFLLRFSDSVLGGLSVAWRDKSDVTFIEPFTDENLKTRSLSKRMHDLNQLITLYPGFAKNLAFKRDQESLLPLPGRVDSQYSRFIDMTTSYCEPETENSLDSLMEMGLDQLLS